MWFKVQSGPITGTERITPFFGLLGSTAWALPWRSQMTNRAVLRIQSKGSALAQEELLPITLQEEPHFTLHIMIAPAVRKFLLSSRT